MRRLVRVFVLAVCLGVGFGGFGGTAQAALVWTLGTGTVTAENETGTLRAQDDITFTPARVTPGGQFSLRILSHRELVGDSSPGCVPTDPVETDPLPQNSYQLRKVTPGGLSSYELLGGFAVPTTGTHRQRQWVSCNPTTTNFENIYALTVSAPTEPGCYQTVGVSPAVFFGRWQGSVATLAVGDVSCVTTTTVVIEKQTIPNGDPTKFAFTVRRSSGAEVAAPALADGESQEVTDEPGEYIVTEDPVEGWTPTSIKCTGHTEIVNPVGADSPIRFIVLTVPAAATVRCVFTNTAEAIDARDDDYDVDPTRASTDIEPLGNDQGVGLQLVSCDPAARGRIVSITASSCTYVPPHAAGPDSFTYTIRDKFGKTDTATVHIRLVGCVSLDAQFDMMSDPTRLGRLFLEGINWQTEWCFDGGSVLWGDASLPEGEAGFVANNLPDMMDYSFSSESVRQGGGTAEARALGQLCVIGPIEVPFGLSVRAIRSYLRGLGLSTLFPAINEIARDVVKGVTGRGCADIFSPRIGVNVNPDGAFAVTFDGGFVQTSEVRVTLETSTSGGGLIQSFTHDISAPKRRQSVWRGYQCDAWRACHGFIDR